MAPQFTAQSTQYALPVLHVASANGTQLANARATGILEQLQSATNRLKLGLSTYPPTHPAVVRVQEILNEMPVAAGVRVHVLRDTGVNAFTFTTNEIFITEGLLNILPSKSAVQAVFQHELSHQKNKDVQTIQSLVAIGNFAGAIAASRSAEFIADFSELYELNKQGLNCYGAFEVIRALKQNIPAEELSDFIHGDPDQRYRRLEDQTLVVHLRNLNRKTEPCNFKELFEKHRDWPALSLEDLQYSDPTKFYTEFSSLETKHKRTAMHRFVRFHIKELSSRGAETLSDYILCAARAQKYGEKLEVNLPRKLLQSGYFERLHLTIDRADYLNLGFLDIRELMRSGDTATAAVVRSELLDHIENLGWNRDIAGFDLDTEIAKEVFKTHAKVNPFRLDITRVSRVTRVAIKMEDKVWSPSSREICDIFKQLRMRRFNIGDVITDIFTEVGVGRILDCELHDVGSQSTFEVDSSRGIQSDLFRTILHQIGDDVFRCYLTLERVSGSGLPSAFDQASISSLPPIIRSTSPAEYEGHGVFNSDDPEFLAAAILLFDTTFVSTSHEHGQAFTNMPSPEARPESYPFLNAFWRAVGASPEVNRQSERLMVAIHDVVKNPLERIRIIKLITRDSEKWSRGALSPLDDFVKSVLTASNFFELKYQLDTFLTVLDIDEGSFNDDPSRQLSLNTERGREEILERLEQAQTWIDLRNRILPEFPLVFGRREKSTLTDASGVMKTALFQRAEEREREVRTAKPKRFLSNLYGSYWEWPIYAAGCDRSIHTPLWTEVTSTWIQAHNKSQPSRSSDFTKLFELLAFAQPSIATFECRTYILEGAVLRAENFNEAFTIVTRYRDEPSAIFSRALKALEKRAGSKRDLRRVRDFMFSLGTSETLGLSLLAAEQTGHASGNDPAETQKVLLHAMTTQRSDRDFKEYAAKQYYQLYRLGIRDDLTDVAQLAVSGETGRISSKFNQALMRVQHERPYLFGNPGYLPFEEMYSRPFVAGEPIKYLVVQEMLMGTPEKPGPFHDPNLRKELFEKLLNYYLYHDRLPSGREDAFVKAFCTACGRTSANELLFHLSPFLTRMTCLTPDNPFPTAEVGRSVLSLEADFLRGRYSRLDEAPLTAQLLEARTSVYFSGVMPERVQLNQQTGKLEIEFPAKPPEFLEDKIVPLLNASERKDRPNLGGLSPVDLAIELGERGGILARRLLQLAGMFLDLSDEDREKFRRVYDRLEGEIVTQIDHSLEQEANFVPDFKPIYDAITKYRGILGGGSMATTASVLASIAEHPSIERWAVSNLNANALFHLPRSRDTLKALLSEMAEETNNDPTLVMLTSLVDVAYRWTLRDCIDPNYFTKNVRFAKQVRDFKGPTGLSWMPEVPTFLDTGTNQARVDEEVLGPTLASCTVNAEADAQTNLEEKNISDSDAKEVASLLVRQVFNHLFEGDVSHANITLGNVMVRMKDGKKQMMFIDRRGLIEFSTEEREAVEHLFLGLLNPLGNKLKTIEKFATTVVGEEKLDPALRETLTAIAKDEDTSGYQKMSLVLNALFKHGALPDDKWLLIAQNILGCNDIAKWAGFRDLGEAFFYCAPETPYKPSDILKATLPALSKRAGKLIKGIDIAWSLRKKRRKE